MSLEAHRLDPDEALFHIPSPWDGQNLFLRHLGPKAPCRRAVIYIHGATFASGLSIAHRFDGRSWRDDLVEAGWHVWGFDQLGFGGSDRQPALDDASGRNPPVGTAAEVAAQLAAVVDFVCRHHDIERVSLIAHSWGSMPASFYAGMHPGRVERLALFAPIGMRDGAASPLPPAWRLVTVEDQWRRFIAEVPAGEPGVLSEAHFADWAPRWLASDPGSETREPPANKIPTGPVADIMAAGAGVLPYLPERVRAPVMIVRGEWDSWPTAADADRLAARFTQAAEVRQATVPRGTHLLHLEQGRTGLYRAVRGFLG